MKIDIIGAGIGGLTTAIALKQKNKSVRVFEQANEIKPVGAGIILASNAMQVFKHLGKKDVIELSGNYISTINITTPSLKVLSSVNLSLFENKFNVKNIAIHRGKLQQILMSELTGEELYLGHKLNSITKRTNGQEITFCNNSYESSILLGADGINSEVRKHLLLNERIRKIDQLCWRGVVNYKLPEKYKHQLNEAWGKKLRFGFTQISNDEVYWYALKTCSSNTLSIDALKNEFKDFHGIVSEIMNETPNKSIHISQISDLKPINQWYKNNICLLGDAAHATTPNLGQGACQAIEDAYVLANCLSKYKSVKKAFYEYQTIRIKKAHTIVNKSKEIGEIAHWSNSIAVFFRNGLLKLMPKSINNKQNEMIFTLPEL